MLSYIEGIDPLPAGMLSPIQHHCPRDGWTDGWTVVECPACENRSGEQAPPLPVPSSVPSRKPGCSMAVSEWRCLSE